MRTQVGLSVVAALAVVAISACDASESGSGTASRSTSVSSSKAPSPTDSPTPTSSVPTNPSPGTPTTRATQHPQADIGSLPKIPADDCFEVAGQTTGLGVMQSMATTQYEPDGTLNPTFLSNYADVPATIGKEQQSVQAVLDRAAAAGYPTSNPISASLQALVSAYAILIGHAQAGDTATFFADVVTAQTAFDNLQYDIGSNCTP